MDPEEKDTTDQLEERFKTLPKVVRDAITSANVEKHLRELAKTHQLHLDQWETLENEVMLTLLGFQPIEDLGKNIESEVGVPNETAKLLASDISKTVFEPIRVELERELESAQQGAQAPKEREKTPEPEQKAAEVAPQTQTPPAPVPTVAPATPPTPAPTEKAARAPMSEAYKAGEPSTARRAIEDDPYREPLT